MKIIDQSPIEYIPLDQITVEEGRQRKNAEPDEMLIDSIRSVGLLQPIIIKGENILVAGERRFRAHLKLNLPTIAARRLENLSPENAQLVELHENIARKALTWQEEVSAVNRYHEMKKANFAGWTIMATATDVGLSQPTVSRYITVAAALDDEEVSGCQTFSAAHNLLTNRSERAIAAATSRGLLSTANLGASFLQKGTVEENTEALMDSLNVDSLDEIGNAPAVDIIALGEEAKKLLEAAAEEAPSITKSSSDDIILTGDFSEWALTYTGPKFDVLHVDFPYGKNYKGSNTRRTGKATANPLYDDRPDVFFQLTRVLLENADNFTHPIAHCLFWFDMEHYTWTVDAFTEAGWKLVQPHPLLWTKGYSGVAADPKRRPRHCYETALLFSRGDRKLANLDKDHFEHVGKDEELHTNQKPREMLAHFLNLIVDEYTSVLDPTCGSGSAIATAMSLGAKNVLGIELDPSNADIARFLVAKEI